MLFNSGVFLKFFAAFLLLYFLLRHHLQARNVLIVVASYLFYGWWDYRFLSLLAFSSLLDYGVGLGLQRLQDPNRRKLLLGFSMLINLSILGFFKYYDFFAQSLAALMTELHIPVRLQTLNLILPVGISFYTFQSMSYAIDVYRGQVKATRNLVNFLAFVSFFPQLVAGPIERARHLLPQFEPTLKITRPMLEEGLWLCLWGMFQKVVLADNLAPLVEMVYGHSNPGGPMVVLGTMAFAFQIYCDFAGYSDIARGSAKLLGFDIMVNFNLPYAAVNLRDFWRRWHVSFSTWLRDYLYISLGGNRLGALRTHFNIFVTMLLGGLWHGAAWNFVLWGLWHGAGLSVHRLWTKRDKTLRHDESFPLPLTPRPSSLSPTGGEGQGEGAVLRTNSAFRFLAWLATMLFVLYGWLLFRAGSFAHIVSLTRALGTFSLPVWTQSYCLNLAVFTLPLAAMQIWQAKTNNLLAPLTLPRWAQALLQGVLLIAIVLFWEKEKVPFIYFQF
jgi:D-alanyl-lipoteichoic acid acyltransferase DltB (MBOAT superfamily)